jgi:hypothetical protein
MGEYLGELFLETGDNVEAGRDHIMVKKRNCGHWKNSLRANLCKISIK